LVVIQVNGKLRGKFTIDASADDDLIQKTALSDFSVQKFIKGKTIKKVIVVKKKLVNIVV
jgi:leucyl-tRNA synthetase